MGEAFESCSTYQLRNSRFFRNKWCLRKGEELLVLKKSHKRTVNTDAINLAESHFYPFVCSN